MSGAVSAKIASALVLLRDAPSSALFARPAFGGAEATDPAPLQPDVPRPDLFRDIDVMPSHRLIFHGQLVDGGPVWPQGSTSAAMRHYRDDRDVANPAAFAGHAVRHIRQPCIWGGYAARHFGHLVGEHATRLPAALHHRPQDPVLFAVRPEWVARHLSRLVLPQVFFDVMQWMGVPPDRVRFVVQPLRMAELYASGQAEWLDQSTPPNWYLDLLDANPRRQLLPALDDRMVFVTRSGLLAKGAGGNAGERALAAALRRFGVTILDPGTARLDRQLALYSSARELIFSEGSALHGRQLLGRLPQRITVLRRRPDRDMARDMLRPRCVQLDYVAATRSQIIPRDRNGAGLDAFAISFYDVPGLFAAFADIGIPLASQWDAAEYDRAVAQDAADWIAALARVRPAADIARTLATGAAAFTQEGLAHLLPRA